MQTVSQAWKDAQRQTLVPESFVEIILNVGDPESQADATPSDNGHVPFSNVGQVADETEKSPLKYATLETNIWGLDGSMVILPDAPPYGNNGYIGDAICGADGTYTTNPTITISFSKVFEAVIPGLTISWGTAYGEYASRFRVTAYNGTVVSAQREIADNMEMTSVVEMDISNYNKIVIEVLNWSLPYRRARIESILVGIKKTYTKSDLMKFEASLTADPLSASLPKSEIVFELKNLNGEYNPDNPRGAEKYLMDRQEITARYGYRLNGEIEWIKGGTYYMSEWDTPQNGITASFTARDMLEYMSDTYTGAQTGTLMAIATAALKQADLPLLPNGAVRWSLDQSLSGISTPAEVDLKEASIMEVLQYVANAACCVLYQDRNGILHIEPLATGTTDYQIDQDNSYSNSEITLSKQLKAVNINNGQYELTVGAVGETQKVNNPLISAARAPAVAKWIADYLQNRRVLSGEFRPDPRLDALDRIRNENQFAESIVVVTEVKYTYNGAFRGSYEGRAGV